MSEDLLPYGPFVRRAGSLHEAPLPDTAPALAGWRCRERSEPTLYPVLRAVPDYADPVRPRRARRPRRCTIGSVYYATRDRYRGDDEVPMLRLRGLWLEALGFTVGRRVRITTGAGVVLLSVEGAEGS
ncbi:SymE family type I addiction module toxin [Luteimonas sp. gir]|uniref:SymE family type I addiction module toxin n=1 Tax=Luteimonas sp. gir TaxID=3127960 RepID=UPI003075CC19